MRIISASQTHSTLEKINGPITRSIRENAIQAAFTGLTAGLEEFVKNGGDINQPVKTPLWPQGIHLLEASVQYGNLTSFEWLLHHGAKTKDVRISGNPLLIGAIERHSVEICKILIQQDRASLPSMRDRYGSDLMEVVSFTTHCDAGKEIQQLVEEALKPRGLKTFEHSKDVFELSKSSKRRKSFDGYTYP